MKKYYFLSILIIALGVSIFIIEKNKNQKDFLVVDVFKEKTVENTRYYLSCAKVLCNSQNIDTLFSPYNIEITKLYPQNNLVLNEDKILQQLQEFSFYNIEYFVNNYINILTRYGLRDDIEKINKYGVSIAKIEINASKEELQKILVDYPLLKYSRYLNGYYR